MRDKTSSAAGQQKHQQHNSNHHPHNNRHPNSGTRAAPPPPPPTSTVMASDLSEQHIFSPGAVVEVFTVSNENVTGEVLAFEYDAKLLILKSLPINGPPVPYTVTCLNLDLCSKVNILVEPSEADRAAAEIANSKLPDIDLKKLEDRLKNSVAERKFTINAFSNGAGIDGLALYTRLQKTVGDHFGVSWDSDSIIIGKNIQIAKPYGADCISVRNVGPNSKPTSLDYAKQLVEKYWRDQEKDPYTLESVNGAAGASTNSSVTPSPQPQSKPLLSQPPTLAAVVSQTPPAQPQPKPAAAPAGPTAGQSHSTGQSPKGAKGSGGGGDHHRGPNANRKSSPQSANQPHPHSKQQMQQQNNHHHEPVHHQQSQPQQQPQQAQQQQAPPQRTKARSYAALLAQPDGDKKTNSGSAGAAASSGPPSVVRG